MHATSPATIMQDEHGALQPASLAVDGSDATRWESEHGYCSEEGCFEQHLEVDLGAARPLWLPAP